MPSEKSVALECTAPIDWPTSLLEGLVWGNRAARHVEEALNRAPVSKTTWLRRRPPWDEWLVAGADPALIQGDMQTIQNVMWHYVGLVRNAERLSRAIRELRHLWNGIETFYRTTKLANGLIGLRNAIEVALLIAQAAQHNRQSRGCHLQGQTMSKGNRVLNICLIIAKKCQRSR